MTKAEQAALRKRAYAWLTEELKKWQRRAGDDPRLRPTLVKQLVEWQTAPQFAGVRNASALDALPAAEGEQWRQIWLGVQAAIRKAKAM